MVTNRSIIGSTSASALVRKWRQRVTPDGSAIRPVAYQNTSLYPVEFVLRKGFPYAPDINVTSRAFLSAAGEYIADSTYPYDDIFIDANSRFIAQENQFDDVADKWTPFFSTGVNYYFTWSGLIEPTLEVLDYRIGKLVYSMNSLRIPAGAAIHSSFNDGNDDASSFMIALAGTINSTENASLLRVGDTPANAIEVTVGETIQVSNQFSSAVMRPAVHPAQMIPFYLILISDPSRTEIRIATGTSRNQRLTLPNRAATRPLSVHLGSDLMDQSTLDMNLFEITLFPYTYDGPMSPDQIIASMADVYGSNV